MTPTRVFHEAQWKLCTYEMGNYLGNNHLLVGLLDMYALCGPCVGPLLIKYVAIYTIPRGCSLVAHVTP